MKVGKNKRNVVKHKFEVDTWDVYYDEQENLIENKHRKTKITEVEEMKQFGFVLSSNVTSIADKQMKDNDTRRIIKNMIKRLKIHTVPIE